MTEQRSSPETPDTVAWNLRFLGPTRIEKQPGNALESAGGALPRFRSRRTLALLGYLVAEQRPVSRDFLAALFWPDADTSQGRANLRRELYNLSKILPNCWASDRQTAAFAPPAGTIVDLYRVVALAEKERWEEAAEFLAGQFLEGLFLENNLEFENWLMAERSRWRQLAETVLTRVIEGHSLRGRYAEALKFTYRLLQQTPWHEAAHRQAMRLLAWTGRRTAALRQFETCKQVLWEELAVAPAANTRHLYRQIQAGELDTPPTVPAFLTDREPRHRRERPSFVAGEKELNWLNRHFEMALGGQSQVVFVTGGPGRGKSALLDAFARQAMARYPGLLAVKGSSHAFAGIGDPYLPFRDVMTMLTGDVESQWQAGLIGRGHARRLWSALPVVLKALVARGPNLLNVLVPGTALLSRAALTQGIGDETFPRLQAHLQRQEARAREIGQAHIFQETTDVLHAVAEERPLLLFLDDFQWADAASIGLLFHLGRRLTSTSGQILIVCAYRPEEVAFGREGRRHPLAPVLSEFQRALGAVWLGLGPAGSIAGRHFIDALLDSQPNRLRNDFRAALFRRTRGHPLFTVELLQAMQERGDIQQDQDEKWAPGPALNWDLLPVRAEAVIAERIQRLDPTWQELLRVASVEGEVFTAQVVAQVRHMPEGQVLNLLTRELGERHRLVWEDEEVLTPQGRLWRFRFGHVLFQEYLYRQLGAAERRHLHAGVATAMEQLYADNPGERAVQLGHHFDAAGDSGRALSYLILAAERAARMYAKDEAVRHYSRAVELANTVSLSADSLAGLYQGRGLVFATLGDFDRARVDLEMALQHARPAGDRLLAWRVMLDLGKLWSSQDYDQARGYFEQALDLARRLDEPTCLARSLNWMGNWYANAENPAWAIDYHQQALDIFQKMGDTLDIATTLDLLGIAHLLGGNHRASVGYYNQAIPLFQQLEDDPRLLSSLMGRGTNVSLMVLLTTRPISPAPDALADIQAAIRLAKRIQDPTEEAWAQWTLGLLYTVRGEYGLALNILRHGLRITAEMGHGEWLVGNQFALGVLYNELLAPEQARPHLEQALERASNLRSAYWINHICGALAATQMLVDNRAAAQSCLEEVLKPDTAMDTMGKRYCWAQRARLALVQGEPALALDITGRLIASASGMSAGAVITFLWRLQGQALAAQGRPAEAQPLLLAALENARIHQERYQLWRVQAGLGQLYRQMGHEDKARQSFAIARQLTVQLADTIPDQGVKERFLRRANPEEPFHC